MILNLFKNILATLALTFSSSAMAIPQAPGVFCDEFSNSPLCKTGAASCSTCHIGAPKLNDFGKCIKPQITGDFEQDLRNALQYLADEDCDGDGFTNRVEIDAGSKPGDSDSVPVSDIKDLPERRSCSERDKDSDWNICGYDLSFTYKRMHRDFCGKAPTFIEVQNFNNMSQQAQKTKLHEDLDNCMDSEYWKGKDGFVWQLAHPKIRPLQTLKSGDNKGQIPLGDYDDDYHLFMYYHLEGRDARGLLTAQHFVMREDGASTKYHSVEQVPRHPNAGGIVLALGPLFKNRQQYVPIERRAGLLTTMWNASFNTMFTSIPRTTAAHALRAYLDVDIAKSQGLIKPNDPSFELVDHDSKGIKDPACAFCHEVLDPASYPFTKYNGLSFKIPFDIEVNVDGIFDPENEEVELQLPDWIPENLIERYMNESKILVPGMYKERRMELIASLTEETEPNVIATPEKGFLFGKPVNNLIEWAEVAANSDYFAKSVVKDYWRPLVRKPIEIEKTGFVARQDESDFDHLWRYLKSKNYSIKEMLHELVRSKTYGAP